VEEGLARVGLHLRIKGGGLSIHDGRQEVKASDVARLFSRGNMEERLRKLSDYRRTRPAIPAARPAREPEPPAPPRREEVRPEPASLGPVLSPTGAPAPEPEQVAEPEPSVARVQPPEPARPVPAPLPISTPERPVRRPPPREPAKQPPAAGIYCGGRGLPCAGHRTHCTYRQVRPYGGAVAPQKGLKGSLTPTVDTLAFRGWTGECRKWHTGKDLAGAAALACPARFNLPPGFLGEVRA
jgi:hypothetical protein